MAGPLSLVVLDPGHGGPARCLVCGSDIPAGEGLTVRLGDRTLRFKCPTCLKRFEADPDRYLTRGPDGCCQDDGRGGPPASARASDETGELLS